MWRTAGPLTSGGLTMMRRRPDWRKPGRRSLFTTAARCWAPRWRMRGHWRFTPDPLGEGEHRLSTTVTDVAGNTSGHSPDFVLTVDTTVAPVSDLQVTDDVAQHTGPLTSGGLTNDATPALSGTAEAGATVTIYDGSTVLGTAVADEDGHWRFTPDPLGEGEHRLSTTVTDVAGNTSGHSPERWTPPWRRSL